MARRRLWDRRDELTSRSLRVVVSKECWKIGEADKAIVSVGASCYMCSKGCGSIRLNLC